MILFLRNPTFNAGRPKMKGFKNLLLFSFGLFWSQLQDFCCDLKCGHDKEFDVTTFSFLSFLYLSRDLSFTVSTFFSVLLFPHPAFLVATFWISVATRKFLGLPKQSNSQQFQFIQIQSRKLQLNSSSSCKYSTKSSTMHHIQNLSTRTN